MPDRDEQVYIVRQKITQATYTDPGIPFYTGNPFIEALPPILSIRKAYKALRCDIVFDESHRKMPPEQRLHMTYHARGFFKPYSQVTQLEANISIAIRAGYISRNPFARGYWQQPGSNIARTEQELNNEQEFFNTSQAPLITIIGMSGAGKSYSIERVLCLYPQAIRHHFYKGEPFLYIQVVWLKVNCPVDGTVRGLCLRILLALDNILGTSYYRTYGRNGRATKDELTPSIHLLIKIHAIGCIVIDEIQYLTAVRESDKEETINLLVELENMDGTPIFKIGTYKARSLFDEFREARRASGLNPVYWRQMDRDKEWDSFVEMLWVNQYTKSHSPLTPELSRTLYEISQGILDFAVKAYIFAQFRAIMNGKEEEITPELLLSVARDHYQPANKMLEALRTNDFEALKACEDIYIDLDEVYDKVRKEYHRKQIAELEATNNNNKGALKDKEIGSSSAQPVDKKNKTAGKKKSGPKPKAKDLSPDDLRFIVNQKKENAISAYDALKAAGYIKSATEFLD